VNRGLWDYLHEPAIARNYDAGLAGSTLFHVDEPFAARHFDRPGKLIDLGCGTGRLLGPFARKGYWVLGVDLSEEMLKCAGSRALQEGLTIHRLKANLVELDGLRDQSFDYAACLFSTFGMIAGAENRRRMLGHVFRLLRPGGKFVLHVHNRWFNFWNPQGRRWLLRDCLRQMLGKPEAGDRVMPVHQNITGLILHLFSRREASLLLKKTGFRIVEIQPVCLRPDGRVVAPALFGRLRAYGYMIAAEKAGAS
jgi:ubiquinone/menaquinone biosynthesis C-methylase UbiE